MLALCSVAAETDGTMDDIDALRRELAEKRVELDRQQTELDREREALRSLALDLTSREQRLLRRERAASSDAVSGDETTGETADEPSQETVAHWLASNDPTCLYTAGPEPLLLARIAGDSRLPRQMSSPQLRIQLRSVEGYPVVVLLLTPDADSPEVEGIPRSELADQSLYWLLDPAAVETRDLLGRLSEKFTVRVALHDDEGRPSYANTLSAPLEGNARHILAEICRLPESDAENGGFDVAVATFEELGAERIGQRRHGFSADSFLSLPSPAAARVALSLVDFWSQKDNSQYLTQVASFSLEQWRGIRKRVVQAALDFGLFVTEPLVLFAVDEGLVENRTHLLRTCLANFAEVSLRLKPSDLAPPEEADNWERLIEACNEHGVEVEVQLTELARAATRRSDASRDHKTDHSTTVDLSGLSDAVLHELLGDRTQRRDAGLELCRRNTESAAEAVWTALRKMSRDEVAQLLPATLSFGDRMIALYRDGLSHRKSFVRQGCALSLCLVGHQPSAEAVLELILTDATAIWMEVGRAFATYGETGLVTCQRIVCDLDGETRQRLIWVCAHLALRPASRRDLTNAAARRSDWGEIARRALAYADRLAAEDLPTQSVQPGGLSAARRFSRTFYESVPTTSTPLAADEIEIRTGQIVGIEEVTADLDAPEEILADSDILDEEVEVIDEDIVEEQQSQPAGP